MGLNPDQTADDLHRTAKGIIAARDARIAELEAEVKELRDRLTRRPPAEEAQP